MIELPEYDYAGLLGAPGNFGSVYHAKNRLTGVDVAIKHIDAPMTPAALASWQSEARAMAACDHENLVAISHAVVTAHGPALVMEYLPDGSVAGFYGDDPAPVARAIDIAVDCCWGLHRLHLAGLTHRDIKPANLLLDGHRVKIGDFGLAASLHAPSGLVYSLHTPPEVRQGDPWTAAADIYALGATAWRLVWGDGQAGRHDPDVAARAAAGEWPDRGSWPLHVHRRLRTVLRSALHPDPARRQGTAAELRHGLERARPIVNWRPTAAQEWVGTAEGAKWTVEMNPRGALWSLTTTKDLGNGPRRVSAGCADADAADAVQAACIAVLETVATSGAI